MIIERLTLHDFGVFAGRIELDLAPRRLEGPVVLIGGRNGRGKTTILDAIRLALYGHRAELSKRKDQQSWHECLREYVHQGCREASVTLDFSIDHLLGRRHYRISRVWEATSKSVKERLDVAIDGALDTVAAQQWDEHVETIIPSRIAALNFFDGERVQMFADPIQSRDVIKSTLDDLLGVGLLTKLQTDLKTYLRKTAVAEITDASDGNTAAEMIRHKEIDEELITLRDRIADLERDRAEATTRRDRASSQVTQLDDQLRELGSDQWARRSHLEQERRALIDSRREHEDALLLVAAGTEPLRLLTRLLAEMRATASADLQRHEDRLLTARLETRDERVLAELPDAVRAVAAAAFAKDRAARAKTTETPMIHDDPRAVLAHITEVERAFEAAPDVRSHLDHASLHDTRLLEIDRVLATVPSDETILPLFEQRVRRHAELEQASADIATANADLEVPQRAVERLLAERARVEEAIADARIHDLDVRRARAYAARAISTVEVLAERTITSSVSVIGASILEKMQILLGKTNFITDLRIDPKALELLVTSREGVDLPLTSLSAGERQIVAVACLWGLSAVANHPLPLVIDTPLGRLDQEHRTRLVDYYFPQAANQVIMLSTDTEIEGELLERLLPALSHSLILDYDDDTRSTTVGEGYFAEATSGR